MNKISNNLGVIQTISIMIGMIVIGAIVADSYSIVQRTDKQTTQTQLQVNKTVAQLLAGQTNANLRGNSTIEYFTKVFQLMLNFEKNIQGNLTDHRIVANATRDMLKELINVTESNSQQSLENQEQFFKPYLNKSFTKLFKALNITIGD